MSIFQLNRIGIQVNDGLDFSISRARGTEDYTFLCFLKPVQFRFGPAIHAARAGACILFTPDFPQFFSCPENEMLTHWFHFDCLDGGRFIEQTAMPLNTVFYPENASQIGLILREVQLEGLGMKGLYQEAIDARLRLLFIDLARKNHSLAENIRHNGPLFQNLVELRQDLANHPEQHSRIGQLASQLRISQPHLYRLYKQAFHTTPMQDLIGYRLERAKYYLVNSNLSVKQISETLGYENQFHFIRQFKQFMGMPPGKYKHQNPTK